MSANQSKRKKAEKKKKIKQTVAITLLGITITGLGIGVWAQLNPTTSTPTRTETTVSNTQTGTQEEAPSSSRGNAILNHFNELAYVDATWDLTVKNGDKVFTRQSQIKEQYEREESGQRLVGFKAITTENGDQYPTQNYELFLEGDKLSYYEDGHYREIQNGRSSFVYLYALKLLFDGEESIATSQEGDIERFTRTFVSPAQFKQIANYLDLPFMVTSDAEVDSAKVVIDTHKETGMVQSVNLTFNFKQNDERYEITSVYTTRSTSTEETEIAKTSPDNILPTLSTENVYTQLNTTKQTIANHDIQKVKQVGGELVDTAIQWVFFDKDNQILNVEAEIVNEHLGEFKRLETGSREDSTYYRLVRQLEAVSQDETVEFINTESPNETSLALRYYIGDDYDQFAKFFEGTTDLSFLKSDATSSYLVDVLVDKYHQRLQNVVFWRISENEDTTQDQLIYQFGGYNETSPQLMYDQTTQADIQNQ